MLTRERKGISMDVTFFSWASLGTFAGALAAVMLITELIKETPLLKKVPTQLVSWVLGTAVLVLAHVFTDGLDWQKAALCILNGALVALAANGGYAAVKRIFTGTGETTKEN